MNAFRTAPLRLGAGGVAGAYIGTVIGAGFASGQETLRFFGLHGRNGLFGLLLCALLFFVYGAAILELGRRYQARSHYNIVVAVMGGGWPGRVADALITCSLLSAVAVMSAGAGAALHELAGWPPAVGGALMVAVSAATVFFGILGVISALSFATPLLVGGVLFMAALVLHQFVINWSWSAPALAASRYWPLSALLYASYNVTLALAVLGAVGALGDKRTLRLGALLGGLGLGVSSMAVYLALLTQVPQVIFQDVPMLYLVGRVLPGAPWVYTALLLAEIYTTAVAGLYGFCSRLALPGTAEFRLVLCGAAVVSCIVGSIGFSRLVALLYTAMGYVGLGLLGALSIWCVRHHRSL